ncbi:class I SAM-dependent methyltransferase [Flavobacterium okayamense]|uniref:Methyltransferase n=1 Tax=Flavobacterium okayamense TaxID=2830782 RepID=A0ABN6HUH6_9FLAO|nr:class I SAM-dependent methyltransferase [Flavobacterium okayamense]BCY27175.1 methyltransferase [Flavobacterium okayamense]
MKEFWNNRYAEKEYAYGVEPNQFLKENLHLLPKGKILFVAEGEGRNAVFAAQNRYDVYAFDYSEPAKDKALQLALDKKVTLQYSVFDVLECSYPKDFFDAIVLIFAHFPFEIRKEAHQKIQSFLKPNGKILFEAFTKEQLNYNSGGPKEISMLFSEEEVKDEFNLVSFDFLTKEIVSLNEGPYHQGKGSVIRFLATKNAENE